MKKGTRRFIAGAVALVVVVAGVLSYFVFDLLGRAARTDINIVPTVIVPSGSLDNISDPADAPTVTSGPTDSTSPSAGATSTASSGGWGTGRVRVYVVPSIPIQKVEQKDPLVTNILVFGIDARSASTTSCRSDTMIVVSIDKRSGSIKLTSLMRDTQVTIPGRTLPNKLNAAYAFGGVGLMINTINQNFGLDIQKFVMIDLWSSEKIIDMTGGIMADVTSSELSWINQSIQETNDLFASLTPRSPLITAPGNQLLNGRQTIAYGRIRKMDSDYQRTARQRYVAKQLFAAFLKANLLQKQAALQAGFDAIETNMSDTDMIALAMDSISVMGSVKEYRIPATGFYTENPTNYNLIPNFPAQNADFHHFLWGTPLPTTTTSATSTPDATPTTEPAVDTPTPTPTPTPGGS